MGNTNTKLPPSPQLPTKKPLGGLIRDLQEDIVCSICLETFNNPVSIDCGHNFCRDCISVHWSQPSLGYRCPECRHFCSRERMKTDTRLKILVEKISQMPVLEMESELEVPAASFQSTEQAVQLVGLDDEGNLFLNEEALSSCFEQGEVKDAPVCLIAIFGEQRRGKSFLQNFLLRRLQNMGAEEASWMGQEDEPLTGFEWRPGTDSTTKGVWLWRQPFWITSEQGKVALFLIDSEGSLDLVRSTDVSTKLSAFSMLLSSYQIFNVFTMMKDTDLEYLDMFVYVAEMVGQACGLKPFQQLDILVRDWYFPPNFGFQAGQAYLQEVIQKLESNTCRHPQALETLKSSDTHCYLMPFPGKKLVTGTEGTLADMDKDFRECLEDYVSHLARSAGTYLKRDQTGSALTGAQLASKIKCFSPIIKQQQLGFAPAVQMVVASANLKTKDSLQREFAEFIKQQDQLSRQLFAGLKILPSTMAQRLREKEQELVKQCEATLRGDEQEQTETKILLESFLQRETKDFLERYGRRYRNHALTAGVAFGVGAVGLAGGVIGAGVAGAILAAEALVLTTGPAATVAIGALAGTGTFAVVGGGVGAGVGRSIGERRAQEAQSLSESNVEVEEGEEDMSDQRCLIGQQNSL
ncbi:RING finger protein 112 [Sphaerodactylus townsendi]|uniref:RING finger protein 112 n=1 Tax=Sphaerodactylus townsendi TaxID=933632 RepID=UPI002026B382|nr:RING finger protein 112 [Sphaerodactylus townsendi]XP_048374227.1 RING finger protein 112 [Sphaerodactylus townsendi]